MSQTRVEIATGIPSSADLSALAGLPLAIDDGEPRLGPDVRVEEDRVRRLGELASVTSAAVDDAEGERIEYRMLNGVRLEQDAHLADLTLRYELTAMFGNAIGWEAAKTAGHVHVRPPGAGLGFPEIVEVLHGEAGFLIQDLFVEPDGPRSSRAWLVRAGPGDWVVLPPELAHVTIDLGAGPLVFSDIIDREAAGVYSGVAAARGFSWYVGASGELRVNDRYVTTPELEVCDASDWSGPAPGPLYAAFRSDPDAFGWLSTPARFADVAPMVWRRVGELLAGSP